MDIAGITRKLQQTTLGILDQSAARAGDLAQRARDRFGEPPQSPFFAERAGPPVSIQEGQFGDATIRTVVLPDAVREYWRNAIGPGVPPEQVEEFAGPMKAASVALPAPALNSILSLTDQPGQGHSVVLMRNVPIDKDLPPTPLGRPAPDKQTFVSESVLLGVARLIGQPYGYEFFRKGAMVHDITPTKAGRKLQSNEGSEQDFEKHIEFTFSRVNPDYLLLLCLRSDHDGVAATTFTDAKSAYDSLSPEHRELLLQPLYVTLAPNAAKEDREKGVTCAPKPVASGPDWAPSFCVDAQATRGTTPEAQAALASFCALLEDPARTTSVVLRPGDLVIFDNSKVLHGRTPFNPHFELPDRRWLQRTYVRPELKSTLPEDPNRNPRHLDAYWDGTGPGRAGLWGPEEPTA